jgi:two-component system response regulator MprA
MAIVDVMMPGRRRAHRRAASCAPNATALPVLMLTARTETSDRVAGLDAGADDYLAKPFDPPSCWPACAPCCAHARRAEHRAPMLQVDDLRLDPTARRAWRGDAELELSKTEFDLLELLDPFNARHRAGPLAASTSEIWDYDFGPDSKNLAVYISYLRRKVDERTTAEVDPHRARRGVHVARLVSVVGSRT